MSNRTTDADQRVMYAIAVFLRERGFSPSLRELCDMAAISSTSQAAVHLERLADAGLIVYEPRIARSIRLRHADE
jgi:repressor LexA